MGSPLRPTLANAFPVHFEKNWLQNCPSDFKPHYYRQCVENIFAAFQNFLTCHLKSKSYFWCRL